MSVEILELRYPTAAGTLPVRVVRPTGPGPFPAMLDLHGGAWTWFTPEVDFFWCRELAQRGFVMISPTFRTSLSAPWPACFDDVRAAFAWSRARSDALRIDASRVGVIGGSTGGHLAAMLGLHEPEVAWVVALWPILDVEGRYRMVRDARFSSLVERLARGASPAPDGDATVRRLRRMDAARRWAPTLFDPLATVAQRAYAAVGAGAVPRAVLFRALAEGHERTFGDVDTMRRASPLDLLLRGAEAARPPMLVVQGDRDPNLTVEMTERFAAAYRRRGGAVDVFVRRGLGHSYGNLPSKEAEELVELANTFARGAT